jgi:carotenoid cleavage dioxygenase
MSAAALEVTRRHGKALHPDGAPPPGAPAWIGEVDNPYLHGLFAPVTAAQPAVDCPVDAELPRELFGAYLRNGPNPLHPPRNRYHWFDGDGLVQAVWFEDGRARAGSAFVATAGRAAEAEAGRAIWPGVLGPFDKDLPGGPLKDTGNTDLVMFRGELLALWYESGALHALDPSTLEGRGLQTFGGQLRARVSAHSKVCPTTGELVFFEYGDAPPYLRHGVVGRDGSVHLTEVELPGPRRPHDLGMTARHSVLHDFPVFFDPALFARTGKRVPLFHKDVPTRFGVLPRRAPGGDVRWFEFEPCYMLHVVNTWEEGDELVMVGCRADDPTLRPDPADGPIAAMLAGIKLQANLYEWRMDLRTGRGRERKLDSTNAEFPRIHPERLGQRTRYAWLAEIPCEIPATFDALLKVDLDGGPTQRWAYGPGVYGSEATFCPRPGAVDEDDGWVVTLVTDTRRWESAALVFDGRDLTAGPLARVRLPARVPAGFHAAWAPGVRGA